MLRGLWGILDVYKTKNQEPRFAQESLSLWGILDLKPRTKNQDPRFAQESLGNLGSWFLALVWKFQRLFRGPGGILVLGSWFWFGNSNVCSGVLGESWFLVLGFGLEIPRFVQESWGNLGSWF